MEGKWDPTSSESGQFLPLMVGEDGSCFGKGDLFFFLCNRFPDRDAVESASLFSWRRGGLVRMRTYIYIMKIWLAVSFSGVADRERMTRHLGRKAPRGSIRVTRHPG